MILKVLEDYSPEEIKRYDEMYRVLKAYNDVLGTNHEQPLPNYSDTEMSEYSAYRELVIAKECGE